MWEALIGVNKLLQKWKKDMEGKRVGIDLGVIKGEMENDYGQNTLYEILRESEIFLKKILFWSLKEVLFLSIHSILVCNSVHEFCPILNFI